MDRLKKNVRMKYIHSIHVFVFKSKISSRMSIEYYSLTDTGEGTKRCDHIIE